MNKAFNNFVWENFPSDKTPVNDRNLMIINNGIDEIDNRVIMLDTTKATKLEISELFNDVELDEDTGIITFTRKNGATITIDTPMEKIQTGIYYDPVAEKLILPLIDGTSIEADLSRLMKFDEFLDSETIAFSVKPDGKITAIVKESSIEEKHLRPDYLADIKVEAENASLSAKEAESWARGGTGSRPGEDLDNAMEYARQAKESADRAGEAVSGNDLSKIIALIGNTDITSLSSTITGAIKELEKGIFKIIRLNGEESDITSTRDLPVFSVSLTYSGVPIKGLPDYSGDNWFIITSGTSKFWYVQIAFNVFGTKMAYRTSHVESGAVVYSTWKNILQTDGDLKDNIVTFTSGDTENPAEWTDIVPVESGEKQSSLWRKFSLFAKNLRYLWKLCGSNDISGLADGTLTGAVSKLNTDIKKQMIWTKVMQNNGYITIPTNVNEIKYLLYSGFGSVFFNGSLTYEELKNLDERGLYHGYEAGTGKTYANVIINGNNLRVGLSFVDGVDCIASSYLMAWYR